MEVTWCQNQTAFFLLLSSLTTSFATVPLTASWSLVNYGSLTVTGMQFSTCNYSIHGHIYYFLSNLL